MKHRFIWLSCRSLLHTDYKDRLRSYCNDYLKEEIFAEGLVRILPAFSSFLHVAAFSDTEPTEYFTVAGDVGVVNSLAKRGNIEKKSELYN